MTPMRPRQHDATKAEIRREERRRHGKLSSADLEAEAERQERAGNCPLCGAPALLISMKPTCDCLHDLEMEQLR